MTKRKIESAAARWIGFAVTMLLLAAWFVDLMWISDYGDGWALVPSLLYSGACGWLARVVGRGVAGFVDDWTIGNRRLKLLKAEYDRLAAERNGS